MSEIEKEIKESNMRYTLSVYELPKIRIKFDYCYSHEVGEGGENEKKKKEKPRKCHGVYAHW